MSETKKRVHCRCGKFAHSSTLGVIDGQSMTPMCTPCMDDEVYTAELQAEDMLYGDYKFVRVDADLIGATGGTLDIYLQRLIKPGAWTDWLHFAQLAAGAGAIKQLIAHELAGTGVLLLDHQLRQRSGHR